jgi:hypothetical protein
MYINQTKMSMPFLIEQPNNMENPKRETAKELPILQ